MSANISHYASLEVATAYAKKWRDECVASDCSTEMPDKVLVALRGLEKIVTPEDGAHIVRIEYEKWTSTDGLVQRNNVDVRGVPFVTKLPDEADQSPSS